jgi:predicted nucleic acid-binding protein
MIRVLVDADLILEVLLNRSSFVAEAEKAFEMLQQKWIQGYVSQLGLEKINSALSKLEDSQTAQEIVVSIERVVKTCYVDLKLMQQARSLNITDFESAVEVACATATNIGAILTSDPQVFVGSDLPILQVSDLCQRQDLERMLQRNGSPVLIVGNLPDFPPLQELSELDTLAPTVSEIFVQKFQEGWKTWEEVFGTKQLSFRSAFKPIAQRVKKIELGDGLSLALVIKVVSENNNEIELILNLYSLNFLGESSCLPVNSQLAVLDPFEEAVMIATSKIMDIGLQLAFYADIGDKFSVRIEHAQHKFIEHFIV